MIAPLTIVHHEENQYVELSSVVYHRNFPANHSPRRVVYSRGNAVLFVEFGSFITDYLNKYTPGSYHQFARGDSVVIYSKGGKYREYFGTIKTADPNFYYFTDGKKISVSKMHENGHLLLVSNPHLKTIKL